MTRNKVVVLGGNFGGLTDALAVQHELDGDVDVRVVSASDRFLFNRR
jgi:sulfide:quinone oxidoreductase